MVGVMSRTGGKRICAPFFFFFEEDNHSIEQ